MSDTKRCEVCVYFLEEPQATTKGYCRANPPSVMPGGVSVYPTVSRSSICRHFQQVPSEAPPRQTKRKD